MDFNLAPSIPSSSESVQVANVVSPEAQRTVDATSQLSDFDDTLDEASPPEISTDDDRRRRPTFATESAINIANRESAMLSLARSIRDEVITIGLILSY